MAICIEISCKEELVDIAVGLLSIDAGDSDFDKYMEFRWLQKATIPEAAHIL